MSLTTAEIVAMRVTSDVFLPDTCTIQICTQGQDSMGGATVTYSTSATNVACRMDEPKTGGPEQPIDAALGTAVKRIMHLKYDQAITVKDRVVYGGLTYEVAEVLETASWLISRRVIVTKVE